MAKAKGTPLFGKSPQKHKPNPTGSAKKRIEKYLSDVISATAQILAEDLELHKSTIYLALTALKKEGKIENHDGNWSLLMTKSSQDRGPTRVKEVCGLILEDLEAYRNSLDEELQKVDVSIGLIKRLDAKQKVTK